MANQNKFEAMLEKLIAEDKASRRIVPRNRS